MTRAQNIPITVLTAMATAVVLFLLFDVWLHAAMPQGVLGLAW